MTSDFHGTGLYEISIFQVIFATYRAKIWTRRSKNWSKKSIKGCDKEFYHRWMILYIHIYFFKSENALRDFIADGEKIKKKICNRVNHNLIDETKKLKSLYDFNWQCHIFLYLYPVPSYFADKFNVTRAPFNVSH